MCLTGGEWSYFSRFSTVRVLDITLVMRWQGSEIITVISYDSYENPVTGLGSENEPRKFNNCIYKPKNNIQLLVSNEINNLRDQSSLYYLHPKQNGYTLNWDVQRTIYEHLFYDTVRIFLPRGGPWGHGLSNALKFIMIFS